MLRTLVLATTSALALVATSCSGSAPPPAQGSLYIHVSAATNPPPPAGKKCNIAAHNAQIGSQAPTQTSPGDRVQDGNKGASVHCTVKGKSSFSVSGSMRKGSVSFQINGQVPKVGGGDGTASISSFDSTSGATMDSTDNPACTVTPIEIAGGRIWAHYVCPGFINTDSPSTYCQADGFFVFENCSQ